MQVFIGGSEFSLLGCSSGGLKQRKCVLWRGPPAEAEAVLAECGRFHRLGAVSKRMARVGQLFSGVFPTRVELSAGADVEVIGDVEVGEYNFTDGCGSVGARLARRLFDGIDPAPTMPVPAERDYVPCVFQIRQEKRS